MPIDDRARRAMEENRSRWDAVTPVHVRSKMYDVPGFLAGKNSLDQFIVDEVDDVRGKKLLHLQCHFGLDTMNWARLGAEVTGVDYSSEAIGTARKLADDAGIDARFVESNVYNLGNQFDAQFDIVFCSWGVLVWLPDLRPWGRLIASALKPGGFFYIAETHPSAGMLDNDRVVRSTSDLVTKYPYFVGEGPVRFEPGPDGAPDYADAEYRNNLPSNEWSHSLSEIFGSLTDPGLAIEIFQERDALAWRFMKGMVQSQDGLWRMPDGVVRYPLSYSLKARKPSVR